MSSPVRSPLSRVTELTEPSERGRVTVTESIIAPENAYGGTQAPTQIPVLTEDRGRSSARGRHRHSSPPIESRRSHRRSYSLEDPYSARAHGATREGTSSRRTAAEGHRLSQYAGDSSRRVRKHASNRTNHRSKQPQYQHSYSSDSAAIQRDRYAAQPYIPVNPWGGRKAHVNPSPEQSGGPSTYQPPPLTHQPYGFTPQPYIPTHHPFTPTQWPYGPPRPYHSSQRPYSVHGRNSSLSQRPMRLDPRAPSQPIQVPTIIHPPTIPTIIPPSYSAPVVHSIPIVAVAPRSRSRSPRTASPALSAVSSPSQSIASSASSSSRGRSRSPRRHTTSPLSRSPPPTRPHSWPPISPAQPIVTPFIPPPTPLPPVLRPRSRTRSRSPSWCYLPSPYHSYKTWTPPARSRTPSFGPAIPPPTYHITDSHMPLPASTRKQQETWLEKIKDQWIFVTDTVPRIFYLYVLLRIPALYYSRVTRVFEDARLSLPDIKQMYVTSDNDVVQENWDMIPYVTHGPPNYPTLSRFKHSWDDFVDSVTREWQVQNVVAVLLLSAVLTMLQIDSINNDPLSRTAAILALICALMSLLYGCMYMTQFGSMKRLYKAASWAEEAQNTRTLIFWNVWIMLSMPAVWLAWSMLMFVTCIMAFVWRTGSSEPDPSPLDPNQALWPRVAVTAMFALGLVYLMLILKTLSRYGASMDEEWKAKVDQWKSENLKPPRSYASRSRSPWKSPSRSRSRRRTYTPRTYSPRLRSPSFTEVTIVQPGRGPVVVRVPREPGSGFTPRPPGSIIVPRPPAVSRDSCRTMSLSPPRIPPPPVVPAPGFDNSRTVSWRNSAPKDMADPNAPPTPRSHISIPQSQPAVLSGDCLQPDNFLGMYEEPATLASTLNHYVPQCFVEVEPHPYKVDADLDLPDDHPCRTVVLNKMEDIRYLVQRVSPHITQPPLFRQDWDRFIEDLRNGYIEHDTPITMIHCLNDLSRCSTLCGILKAWNDHYFAGFDVQAAIISPDGNHISLANASTLTRSSLCLLSKEGTNIHMSSQLTTSPLDDTMPPMIPKYLEDFMPFSDFSLAPGPYLTLLRRHPENVPSAFGYPPIGSFESAEMSLSLLTLTSKPNAPPILLPADSLVHWSPTFWQDLIPLLVSALTGEFPIADMTREQKLQLRDVILNDILCCWNQAVFHARGAEIRVTVLPGTHESELDLVAATFNDSTFRKEPLYTFTLHRYPPAKDSTTTSTSDRVDTVHAD